MQKGGMIHKKPSVNIYLTYFFEFFLTKLANSFFITWNVLGLSVWKQIHNKILPVVKQPSSMLSSTTWRLTLKSTNLFQTCLFFSLKTKTDFFAMFVCCCGGAPPCDWQLCQAARRCDYSISPFCPFFANHHQSYHWIIAQFCTYKAEAWQALLVLPLYMLDFSIAHLKHDYSISSFCPFFCHHHQSYHSIIAQCCTSKALKKQ